jgi:hypothetical protein
MLLARRFVLASSLAFSLGSAACAHHAAAPPIEPVAPPAAATAPVPAVPPGHLSRVEVDRVLVAHGPPWVLSQVISEEVMGRDGTFVGWRLLGVPEEWSGIDVRPGDVVMRVNGLPVETPDQAWDAWKSVARSPDLKLSVMRDGAARQVSVPIDGVVSAETARALERGPGPQRAEAPERGSIPIGGSSADVPSGEVY